MEKEKALASLLLAEIKLTKEANSKRGETKKSIKEYDEALKTVCEMLGADDEVVKNIVNPKL